MAEYIEREAFLDYIEERYCLPCKGAEKDYDGCMCRACWVDDMRGEVIDAPTADVVPLMRCEECKHWLKDVAGCTDFVGRCELANYMIGAAGYCVYGEKKDGGGNG